MSDYTPTTRDVRHHYALDRVDSGIHPDEATAEFDRWLESVKAQVWDEAVETALAHAIRNEDGITLRLGSPNPYKRVTP